MTTAYNVYCDESCHLERDRERVMVLGAVWCPRGATSEVSAAIRDIKARQGLSRDFEVKWGKVSPAKLSFYQGVLDYFFDTADLHFRALIADKTMLRHDLFGQSHDEWYYKMYFDMLKVILRPDAFYRIYLDIKDTRGGHKIAKLREVLCNNIYDFSREIIQGLQIVRSHEVEVMQVADLLTGVVSYANRGLASSSAKQAMVEHMRLRSGYSLLRTTLLHEDKVNLFVWQPSSVGEGGL